MRQTPCDVMTKDPPSLCRDHVARGGQTNAGIGIGAVVVGRGDEIRGVLTARKIMVRAVADGRDPSTPVGDFCSGGLVTISASDVIASAPNLMRDQCRPAAACRRRWATHRIVSIRALAVELDESSALAKISGAPTNARTRARIPLLSVCIPLGSPPATACPLHALRAQEQVLPNSTTAVGRRTTSSSDGSWIVRSAWRLPEVAALTQDSSEDQPHHVPERKHASADALRPPCTGSTTGYRGPVGWDGRPDACASDRTERSAHG